MRGAFPRISSAALLQEKADMFSFVGVRKQDGDLNEQSVLISVRMIVHMCSSKLSLSFGDELIAATMDLGSLPRASAFPSLLGSFGSTLAFRPLEYVTVICFHIQMQCDTVNTCINLQKELYGI